MKRFAELLIALPILLSAEELPDSSAQIDSAETEQRVSAEFHGYAKLYAIPQFQGDSAVLTGQGRIREHCSGWIGKVHWNEAVELSPSGYAPALALEKRFSFAQDHTPYRLFDLPKTIYPSEPTEIHRSSVTVNLDLLNAALPIPEGTVTIGRQTLGWGAARTINPTDVITPLGFGEMYKEERLGADAVVLRRSVGMTGEIESGVIAGKELKKANSAAFFRLKGTVSAGDLSAAAVYFRDNILIGGEYESSIGKFGVRVEAAEVVTGLSSRTPEDDYLRITAGADRLFSEKLMLYGEYHFSSAGENFGRLPQNRTAFTEGNVRFPGRHYLAEGASHQLHPLWSLSESVMTDLSSRQTMVTISTSLNLPADEQFSADAGAIAVIGGSAESVTAYTGVRFYW